MLMIVGEACSMHEFVSTNDPAAYEVKRRELEKWLGTQSSASIMTNMRGKKVIWPLMGLASYLGEQHFS